MQPASEATTHQKTPSSATEFPKREATNTMNCGDREWKCNQPHPQCKQFPGTQTEDHIKRNSQLRQQPAASSQQPTNQQRCGSLKTVRNAPTNTHPPRSTKGSPSTNNLQLTRQLWHVMGGDSPLWPNDLNSCISVVAVVISAALVYRWRGTSIVLWRLRMRTRLGNPTKSDC
jgi:hypothetical protein